MAAAPASAQINKCKGADGRITYQDTPCATEGQQLDIRNRKTDPFGSLDSELQAQRDIRAARRIDQERELNRKLADIDRSARDREKQAKAARCASYQSSAERAEYWAGRYVTPQYQGAERARAKALRDQHWSECFAGQ